MWCPEANEVIPPSIHPSIRLSHLSLHIKLCYVKATERRVQWGHRFLSKQLFFLSPFFSFSGKFPLRCSLYDNKTFRGFFFTTQSRLFLSWIPLEGRKKTGSFLRLDPWIYSTATRGKSRLRIILRFCAVVVTTAEKTETENHEADQSSWKRITEAGSVKIVEAGKLAVNPDITNIIELFLIRSSII